LEESIALFAAAAIMGIPVAGWIAVRGMEHAERMEMIRRGMMPPPYAARLASTAAPAAAFALALFGLPLLAAAWLIGFSSIAYPPDARPPYALLLLAVIALVPPAIVRALRVRARRRLRALPPSDEHFVR